MVHDIALLITWNVAHQNSHRRWNNAIFRSMKYTWSIPFSDVLLISEELPTQAGVFQGYLPRPLLLGKGQCPKGRWGRVLFEVLSRSCLLAVVATSSNSSRPSFSVNPEWSPCDLSLEPWDSITWWMRTDLIMSEYDGSDSENIYLH